MYDNWKMIWQTFMLNMTELPKAQTWPNCQKHKHDRIAKSTKMTELPKAHKESDLMNLI